MKEEIKIDRRKNPRFLVEDNVIIALQNRFKRIGKGKDISLEGLSFEHVYDEELDLRDPLKSLILWVDDSILFKIPCRIVYDIPIQAPPEYDSLTVQLTTRRCGVQFESFTESQMAQLELFLKTYIKKED
jgi:hypothetical protein